MPCNQIILNKIEISATNLDLLTKALEILIERGTLPYRSGGENTRQQAARIIKQGFISLPVGQDYLADYIKREYSRQAVQAAARKFNWQIQEKKIGRLIVTKRA